MQNLAITGQLNVSRAKTERNSSLELLRIVAILMIIGSHFSQHGGFDFPTGSIALNRIWQQILYLGGQRGNDIFILLSGYFLVSSREGIKVSKLLRVISPFAFYGVFITVLRAFSGQGNLSLHLLFETVNYWWFIRVYIILYLFHPYLNMFLNRISREEYISFLKTAFIFWCIIPTFTGLIFGGNQFIDFVCIYSVGGYFRLWGKDSGDKKFILYGILFMLADCLGLFLIDFAGYKYDLSEDNLLGMMKPFTVAAAVCFLLGFRKLNISHSKIINLFASASLGVYMLHENRFSQNLFWNEIFHTSSFTNSAYLIPYTFAVIIAVYVMCSLFELLRSKIFRTLSRGYLS